jgi:hypothetical protein
MAGKVHREKVQPQRLSGRSTFRNRRPRIAPVAPQFILFYLRRSPRDGLVSSQRLIGSEEWLTVKLDPEERVIPTALDQAELDDANERGAEAWIEFLRDGHAKVTIAISRELVAKARALDWSTSELFAKAVGLALPGAFEIEALSKAPPQLA